MKRISYAGDSFLTADSAADALVELAAVLGEGSGTEVVELPVLDREGHIQAVRLVLSPATQLSAVTEESPYREPEATSAVARLKARARAMSSRYVAVVSPRTRLVNDLDDIDSG